MKNRVEFTILYLIILILFTDNSVSYAKIYIDITSPNLKKLPVSLIFSKQYESEEITKIVKDDLNFTGMFNIFGTYTKETEITVEIDANASDEKIIANVRILDSVKNNELIKKIYESKKSSFRALSHSISNDVYRIVTGKDGVFKTKVTYIVNIDGRKELCIMDWDGYNSHKIIKRGYAFSHNWSNDGKYLTYSSETGKEWNIYLLDLENYKEDILFSSKDLTIVGGFLHTGNIVFSSSKEGTPEIYKLNIDDRIPKKLTKSISIDVSPVFSPDGYKIAFVSDRGGTPQIYIMNVDGSEIKRITFEGNYNTSPVFSPDGQYIAYVSRKSGNNQIFMVKLDDGEIKQITYRGNNDSPSFSPDGMFICFDSDKDGKGIYIKNINMDFEKKITTKEIKAMVPRWSPYLK